MPSNTPQFTEPQPGSPDRRHLTHSRRTPSAPLPLIQIYGKPIEGIWSVLKRGVLANLAATSFAHLVQVMRHGLKKIQYHPRLIEGCLTGTGLSLEPEKSADITN